MVHSDAILYDMLICEENVENKVATLVETYARRPTGQTWTFYCSHYFR